MKSLFHINTIKDKLRNWSSNLNPNFALALAIIFFLSVMGIYAIFFRKFSPTPTGFAEFGSYVGGIVGPVVAMFALYYLVKGIQVQKEELTKTYNLFADQLSQQKYLDLMQTYRSILDTLEVFVSSDQDIAGRGYVLRGKNSITYTINAFLDEINTNNLSFVKKNDWLNEKFSISFYNFIDRNKTFDYETYMNFIYTIIQELSPQNEEINRYFILFRNQLTQSELHLILSYTRLIGTDEATEKIMSKNKLFDNVIAPKNNNSTARVSMPPMPKKFFEELMAEKYKSGKKI